MKDATGALVDERYLTYTITGSDTLQLPLWNYPDASHASLIQERSTDQRFHDQLPRGWCLGQPSRHGRCQAIQRTLRQKGRDQKLADTLMLDK